MRNVWKPGDAVYWDVFASDNRTIRYFSPQVQWRELWGRVWTTQIEESAKQPGDVWVDSTALAEFMRKDPELGTWFNAHFPLGETYEFRIRDHKVGFVKLRKPTPAKP
jgi:hypothetical protein